MAREDRPAASHVARNCSGRRHEADGAHAHISVQPQALTVVAHSRVPAVKVSDGDAIATCQNLATVAGHDEMEPITVRGHPVPRWCGRGNAVSSFGCRRLCSGSRSCGGGSCSADNPHTKEGVEPKVVAGRSDGRVPGNELGKANAVGRSDAGTAIALGNKVKLVTVFYHTVLDRSRRTNTVSGASCSWPWSSSSRPCGSGSCPADNPHTKEGVEPKIVAGRSDGRVPGNELGKANAVGRSNAGTAIALGNKVKLVAVIYHAILDRGRRADAVPSLGGSWGGCGSGGGRGSARAGRCRSTRRRGDAPILLNAVRIA